jgi:catechol 2,3-dioxygenase-like lactoylglutathione lyase family enzyme
MPIQRLDHYSIRTTRLEDCRTFYVDIMGFEVGPRPPFKFPGLWLYNGGVAVVHIVGIDKNDPQGLVEYLGAKHLEDVEGTGTIDHIAFVATGLSEMYARLKAHNTPYRERSVPNLGLHQIFLEDPNGVTIELNYPAAEAPGREPNARASA